MNGDTRVVTGLTGRRLKIPEKWKINDKNEFHIGLLRSFNIFPKALTRRLNKDRSKKFTEVHTKKLDCLRSEIETMTKELQNSGKKESEKDKTEKKENSHKDSAPAGDTDRIDLKSKIEDAKKLLALVCAIPLHTQEKNQKNKHPCTFVFYF